jgi:hypothetical protein
LAASLFLLVSSASFQLPITKDKGRGKTGQQPASTELESSAILSWQTRVLVLGEDVAQAAGLQRRLSRRRFQRAAQNVEMTLDTSGLAARATSNIYCTQESGAILSIL